MRLLKPYQNDMNIEYCGVGEGGISAWKKVLVKIKNLILILSIAIKLNTLSYVVHQCMYL